MKTLTKKQRGEIYLKVAERLSDGVGSDFICSHLRFLTEGAYSDIAFEIIAAMFPEFMLFRPCDNQGVWFTCDLFFENNQRQERIICMLLCYNMTL